MLLPSLTTKQFSYDPGPGDCPSCGTRSTVAEQGLRPHAPPRPWSALLIVLQEREAPSHTGPTRRPR